MPPCNFRLEFTNFSVLAMETGLSRSESRHNRLDRFERSSKRVNAPSWMSRTRNGSGHATTLPGNGSSGHGHASLLEHSNGTATGAAAAESNGDGPRLRDNSTGVRLRYSDYKQRAASASATYRCSAASSSRYKCKELTENKS